MIVVMISLWFVSDFELGIVSFVCRGLLIVGVE